MHSVLPNISKWDKILTKYIMSYNLDIFYWVETSFYFQESLIAAKNISIFIIVSIVFEEFIYLPLKANEIFLFSWDSNNMKKDAKGVICF